MDITNDTYRTLDDIQRRKDELLNGISADGTTMQTLWDSTFHRRKASLTTPTSRFSGVLKTGIGVLDGVILGWKIYRKFKGGSKKKAKRGFFSRFI